MKKIENLLLCVGAQKAGTTWLYSQLDSHPDVKFTFNKEIQYFSTLYNGSNLLAQRRLHYLKKLLEKNPDRFVKYIIDESASVGKGDDAVRTLLSGVDDTWYVKQFLNSDKKYYADFSPEYAIIGVAGYEHAKRISKNQKIIFIMREPVARSLSALRYHIQMHSIDHQNISHDDWDALSDREFIYKLGTYDNTIKNLRKCFDKTNLHFIFFEDMMASKEDTLKKLNEFLEVENYIPNTEIQEHKVNETSVKIDVPKFVVDKFVDRTRDAKKYVLKNFNSVPDAWDKH